MSTPLLTPPTRPKLLDVYWRQHCEADVPSENDWLSADEAVCLHGLRFDKRRADWRLGRWTAKHAIAAYLDASLDFETLRSIEIRPAPSGAPEAFLEGRPADATISLSHRAGIAVCVVTKSGVELGCDLEMTEPRSEAFLADYFTPEEQDLVANSFASDRPMLLALLWSAKESALKALRTGLRLDTRSVIVSLPDRSPEIVGDCCDSRTWRALQVRKTGGQLFHGWWQHTAEYVLTLVAAPPSDPPISCNGYFPATNKRNGVPSAPLIRQGGE